MYEMTTAISSKAIADYLQLEVVGDVTKIVNNIKPFNLTNETSLSFCADVSAQSSGCGLVISSEPVGDCTIISTAPRLSFYKVLNFLIDSGHLLADTSEAILGKDTVVCDGAIIEAGVSIGERCFIGSNAVIRTGTQIGNNTVVKPGAVIGNDGFGFVRGLDGVPHRFPHIGGVKIGDNVEVGSNTCIDKAALLYTEVGSNVKIDNLVHIAHNSIIGEKSMIIAGAEISGSVKLGKGVWVGPNACIIDGVSVGDNSTVGIGAVVTKTVESGVTVAGNPAKKLRPKN